MPSVRMPGPQPDFLVQTEQWFDDEKIKKAGKQELSLATHSTVQLALACLDAADTLLAELGNPKGPHALVVSREIKFEVSELKRRSDRLLAELAKRFDSSSADAVNRLTRLLIQSGYVMTQLHEGPLAEEWLLVGNENGILPH